MKIKINWFEKENIGNTFILIGIGLISGIIAVWINYFLKQGTLFGLSLTYCFIGILIILTGIYLTKRNINITITKSKKFA